MGDRADRVVYFVVGDPKLNSGNGTYVEDLEAMKKKLMTLRLNGDWRLVISMHGAEDVVAAKGGSLKSRDVPGVYDSDAMRKLFADDKSFTDWRDKYGPTWTVMNSCQVNKPFETVLVTSFNKAGANQKTHGLGQDCRPETNIYTLTDARNRDVKTRQHYDKLSTPEKESIRKSLVEMNQKVGYFGSPPVPEALVLDYYFDEEPKGGWPVVTISFKRVNQEGWAFYNRTNNPEFLKTCSEHRGRMRGHTATAPNVP